MEQEKLRGDLQYEAARELWYRGDLSHKLRPEQQLFKDHIDRNVVQLFVGNISRRWGKSFSLVLFAIEQCLKNPGIKIRYGAAFQSDLLEFILPAFAIILEDCPEEIRPLYALSKKTWVFPNGAEIKLVGLDKNPNGLRGNAIAIIIIDEAGFVKKLQYIYTSIIIPATAKQKNIRLVFVSTPPESPDHYFVALIEKAEAFGYYATFTIDDISDLEPAERARLLQEVGGEASVTARREFFCEIIVDEIRAICSTFSLGAHVRPLTRPDHAVYLLSGDTGGVRDLTVCHILCYDWLNGVVLFLDERWFPAQIPSPVWVKEVLEMQNSFPGVIPRFVDAPGQTRVDLSAMHFQSALPNKDEFHSSLTYLRKVFYGNEVLIDPKCKMLIRTLSKGLLNEQRSDFMRSDVTGHADAVMSAIYGLRHVDKTTNPLPKPKKETIFNANPQEPQHIKNLLGL